MIHTAIQKYGPAAIGAGVGLVIVLAILALGRISDVTHTIRATQVSNTKVTQSNAETLRLIRSCTTPGQVCYDRGQRQTAGAVASINRVVILAAACASQHPAQSTAEIQSCVIDGLAKQSHH